MSDDAVRDMYLSWTAGRIKGEPQDPEAWGELTAEPRAVDYVETDVSGLRAMWAIPHSCSKDRVILCMHGGGYLGGSIYTHRKIFAHLAKAAGVRALLFEYPLAPAHTHPAQVDHATRVYRWLLEDQGVDAAHVAFTGDSSGAGLTVSTQPVAGAKLTSWLPASFTCGRMPDWVPRRDPGARGGRRAGVARLRAAVAARLERPRLCHGPFAAVLGPPGLMCPAGIV
jgi:hypothetical protein